MKPTILSGSRSEEVQDIVDRMPTKFGYVVTGIVLLLTVLLFLFGWLVKYPDTVTGAIVISAKYSPIKLVANNPGKIVQIFFKEKDTIKKNDYIAILENPANTRDMIKVKQLLTQINVNQKVSLEEYELFPPKLSLGTVNDKYTAFLSALQKVYEYDNLNIFQKQVDELKHENSEYADEQKNNFKLKDTKEKSLNLYTKILARDSILLADKVATEDEVDNSRASYLNSKEVYESVNNDIKDIEQKMIDNDDKLNQLYLQNETSDNELKLNLVTTYDDLRDEINLWEQQFVFKSPMSGVVDFVKFWTVNQFIQANQEVFTIVPKQNKIIGQVTLPSLGSGKVDIGQDVIIKLDNYPFEEFGSIHGTVKSISLTTSAAKSNSPNATDPNVPEQNIVDTYLVEVDIPNDLKTSFGSRLNYKYEIKGSADIITNKRRLIQRLFDNLKYSTVKQPRKTLN